MNFGKRDKTTNIHLLKPILYSDYCVLYTVCAQSYLPQKYTLVHIVDTSYTLYMFLCVIVQLYPPMCLFIYSQININCFMVQWLFSVKFPRRI